MNPNSGFLRIMEQQTELALATSTDGQPNVRIVNFYFNPENNLLYFATFKGNDKEKELRANPKVAFTTIPLEGNQHVKAKGLAQRSSLSILELAGCFIEKIPDYRETIEQAGNSLAVYEIRFDAATVTLSLDSIQEISL